MSEEETAKEQYPFDYCAVCGDALGDSDTRPENANIGVCADCMQQAPEPGARRGSYPLAEVYISEAKFVKLAIKELTARRMINWLRDYADYCNFAGHTKTGTDARAVANRLANEVEPADIQPVEPPEEDGEDDG